MGKLPITPQASMPVETNTEAALRQPSPLPDNARLLALDSVWMEGSALAQLGRVAGMDDCVAAVGMPDLHAGPGIPIGAALAFGETVHPRFVGSDAGCGARVVCFGKLKVSAEALERRARAAFEESVFDTVLCDVEDEADELELLEAVWHRGTRALTEYDIPEDLAALAQADPEPAWLPPSADLPGALALPNFARSLGTIGGGNHFVELGRVESIVDAPMAEELGVQRRGHAVLAHSGSRGLGRALALEWGAAALQDEAQRELYMGQLAGAVRFAITNRLLLAWRMLGICGAARTSRISGGFDLVHNFVARETAGWVHRKGCAPAGAGEPAVILGSRGTPSWIMCGHGSEACLCSVAHGAGRRMTRSEAKAKIAHKYKRASLTRTRHGRVICADKDLLYEEHPDAYKAIEPVIDSLESAGAARRVAALEPLLTVKM